ncbi:endoribonuclease Dicer [Achroia grisella]|uniref:endoribonuclease Dicer n=1 Tax=Achroia grisella TaxID=688607 RepID=UPI0027D3099C|nr:endoribonuclease Dicer [Achroia grisella]
MDEMVSNVEEQRLICRPYQYQLEEIAIRKNTIIHLPTGSGKTFIAAQLIKRFRHELQKPWGQGGKRIFFLVNNIPLVEQQQKVIEYLCPVKGVGAYSSENKVDYWDKNKWDEELTIYQVIVMTSQIMVDMLTHGYIKIENISLIIFDECHHAIDDHPMRMVMKHFETCPLKLQPRVLGLTSTLLNANVTINKVAESLRDLETTFHATIATVNELGEVLKYSTNPNELLQIYKTPVLTKAALEAIQILTELQNIVIDIKLPSFNGDNILQLKRGQQDITNDPKKIVKAVKNMIVSMILYINEMGVYGGAIGILAHIIVLERLKRKSLTKEEELMYTFTISQSIQARAILLKSMENERGYGKIINHSSEKIVQLLNILKEYNPDMFNKSGVLLKINKSRKPLSCIIFTQQRFTAKILFNLLKDAKELNPEEFGYLKGDFLVGFNINPFKDTREQYYLRKTSQRALLKFSKNELNCIISTSVIEEGVDVPQCSLIVRYDQPLEYRSYIQSKGRARCSESNYIILVNDANKEKFQAQYRNFQKIEQHIQGVLVGKTEDRASPTEQELQDLYEDDIPPYFTEHGNRLSSVSAISLINRYCSILPHDQFTVITPMWIQEKVTNNHNQILRKITIIMPIECPVKEKIEGTPMLNLKSAKRSAALNACIRLHQEGELDPVTLLPRSHGLVEFDSNDIKECFPNWQWDDNENEGVRDLPKAGTKKRMRKHKKMFPSSLKGPGNLEINQHNFYLHVIKVIATFPEPNDSRERALYKLLQRPEGYGLLTPKPLPKLCDFPLFLTVGEVSTTIQVNYAVVPINKTLLDLIKQFHFFIFDQVLAIAKQFLVYDGTENCMFVVPLTPDNGYDIDWGVMQQYTEVPPIGPPSFTERRSLNVTRDNYKYSIVTPWYRSSILPDRYIVSDVLEYMTPQSQFETETYDTYENYYRNKYNLEILGPKDQPMLEVRNITSRMNCLLPRAPTIKSFTEKQQKLISAAQGDDKPKGFLEVFIPEYCIKYEFPGVFWYKAMMLPSIVHRVSLLLIANELRAEIAEETKYGLKILPKGENWLPIELDLEIAINSLRSHTEEPTPINTVDRINNPNGEPETQPSDKLMKKDLYELQMRKIDQQYPWNEKLEPLDIERHLSSVTVMDIECYDEFVSAPLQETTNTDTANRTQSSPRRAATAILPPPPKFNDKIAVLSRTPTGRGPELRDILAALTTIKSHDTFNLERAETLGDSFLKFSASLYLFHKFPKANEGQLTNIKSRLIGNKNLYYAGARVKLGGRMKIEQFSPRSDFMVPGFFAPEKIQTLIESEQIRPTFLIGMQFSQSEALSGSLSDESWESVISRYTNCDASEKEPNGEVQNSMQCYVRAQAVSDKSVADCVEALVGTYLLSGGILGAVKVLEWFRILPPQENFEQFLHKVVPTVITQGRANQQDINFLLNYYTSDVEEILNYKFKDPSHLLEAMSHPTYIRNRFTRSYERLEFLGDAIIDFLITAHIFENSRRLKPGELTDLRSALVNNVTFASYVVKLNLHKYLCSQLNPVLDNAIMNFVRHQEQRDHQIIEDVLYLIDEEESRIAEYVEVPKVLSDIFESLVGAIFLDSGGNLETVWSVIYRIMWKEIENFSNCIPQQPVKVLYERVHACAVFGKSKLTESDIPKVIIPVTVSKKGSRYTVYGMGSNQSQAKRAAAKLALKLLDT